MNNNYSKNLPEKPKALNMKINAYSGWLISFRGMIYSVKAETSRKALNIFKKEIELQKLQGKNKKSTSKKD